MSNKHERNLNDVVQELLERASKRAQETMSLFAESAKGHENNIGKVPLEKLDEFTDKVHGEPLGVTETASIYKVLPGGTIMSRIKRLEERLDKLEKANQ